MKKFLLILLALMCVTFSNVFAADYSIEEYKVYIRVNEDNVFNVTEDITANFAYPKHGIIRKIPIKNNVERNDGTSEINRVAVNDIFVDGDDYTVSSDGEYKIIKIGSASRTVHGRKNYFISYDYALPKDKTDLYDELYFNIIGTEWDTSISNIEFIIEMPKDFDEKNIGFSVGTKGTTGYEGITYNVDDNVIKGRVEGKLKAGEGVNIRIELEEGYFDAPIFRMSSNTVYRMICIAICTCIVYLIWNKHGKDIETVDTVEFYPPEAYNSAEIGFLYRGFSEDMDTISLLLHLANKGYIQIRDEKQISLFSSINSYSIIKLKNYDGTNASEKTFMDKLFKISKVVSKSQFESRIVSISTAVKQTIETKKNKKEIFVKGAVAPNIIIILLMVAVACLSLLGVVLDVLGFSSACMLAFIMLFYTPFWWAASRAPGAGKIFICCFITFHMLAMTGGFGATAWFSSLENFLLVLYGIINLIVMGICLFNMSRRTPFGAHILGRIKGFKRFLEVAEKERVESIVNENPNYVFDILPYMYVLGVSDAYIRKFENYVQEAPSWYDSDEPFSTLHFSHFMNDMVSSARARTVASSSGGGSSSSGGGGSSGGGSSGGGSGGGGGSSW